ncbi:MAG TPA: DUF817 family protein [Myxococcota bacterium]|nr:DUF817 family protein [Myxococcota bacterium]
MGALRAVLHASLFPGFVLCALAVSRFVEIPGVARYDMLLLAMLGMQVLLVATRVETLAEAGWIAIFHLMGVALEIWKVSHGGWAYPEPGLAKVLGVPLFAGFMYASIGSFVLSLSRHVRVDLPRGSLLFAGLCYLNFWTNVWIWDLKPVLALAGLALFWRTRVGRVPILLAFPALGVAIWMAENWGTLFGSWEYPRQAHGWTPVPPDKLLSWTVLGAVAVILVLSRQAQADETP